MSTNPETESAPDSPPLANLRILLAEDGEDNQELINLHLTLAGAEVTLVDDGQKACDAALAAIQANQPFHLILMDMQMPVMDGYQATAHLRSRNYTAPIVALTAHTSDADRQKCLAAGCDDFLSKPIDPATLLTTSARIGRTSSTTPQPLRRIA
jgi:CheY-like chemotaxis protein